MDRGDNDRDRDFLSLHSRAPDDPLARGNVDPLSVESTLAREFAQRALTPLIRDLRDKHGHIAPRKVASALGLTVAELAECLQMPAEELDGARVSPELEERLEPHAMVIGIVRDVYGGDHKRVRVWLRTPRPELEGRTPNQALCVPGGIQAVVQFVLSAWLGNAD